MTLTGTARRSCDAGAIAHRLDAVRARTMLLVEQLSDETLNAVHSPLMSPIVWDLGHIATFEDLWLAQSAVRQDRCCASELGDVYDPNAAPRSERGGLPYLRSEDAFDYMDEVRARVLDLLDGADLSPSSAPLLRDGFVFEMVLRHEQQHTETILQTLQLMTSDDYVPPRAARRCRRPSRSPATWRWCRPGPFEMGAGAGRLRLRQRAPAARRATWTRSASTARRSPTARSSTSSTTAATSGASCGPRRAGRGAARGAATAPALLARATADSGSCARSREWAAVDPRLPGLPRLVVRGRRVRALGGQAPADRGRVGEGGRRDARERRRSCANLDQLAFATRAGRRLPAPARAPAALRQALGRRVGMDRERLRCLPGLRGLPLPRVLAGLLRRPLQGAARRLVGDAGRSGDDHLPQLGLPASAARSSPASAAPADVED